VACLLATAPLPGADGVRQKVLLDTDLAGDIDDSFALALILTSPEFELVGVTLGHGLTDKRAQVACRMLYETGNEGIPVAVGRPTPNITGPSPKPAVYNAQFHWGEGFGRAKPVATPAADFIIQTLRRHPGEVILFSVGPVPNLADVARKDPEALKLAKRIYAMFGSFYLGYGSNPVPSAEWNVMADVESSRAFVESGAPITYAGLDITTFVTLDEKSRSRIWLRQSPLTSALSALYTLWCSETGSDTPVLYDAVAVAMPLWPDLFQTRPAHVRVVGHGYTVIDESRPPNGDVGMSVNKEEFLRRLLKRLVQQHIGRPD
jgi:inosine-uridine nucleoside N-ribohydrolase